VRGRIYRDGEGGDGKKRRGVFVPLSVECGYAVGPCLDGAEEGVVQVGREANDTGDAPPHRYTAEAERTGVDAGDRSR